MRKKVNYVKQQRYAETLDKLNRAVRNDFYYEAIMLDYALIEDRLYEMLYYLGILSRNTASSSVSKRIRKDLRSLLNLKPAGHFCISKMQVRLDILKEISKYHGDSLYFQDLQNTIAKRIGVEGLCTYVQNLEDWKNARNILVHDLMNQVTLETEKTAELAVNGKALFRELDKYCRRIENCDIRKKYKIQPY